MSQQPQASSQWVYAIGDGDNIRQRLETHLLFEDLEGCKKVSEAITEGMKCVSDFLASEKGWSVEFCGGDDILIKVDSRKYNPDYLRQAIAVFERCSKSTISFGSGYSLTDAYLNLRRAKAQGTGRLVCETELTRA
jgi:hypothetical protein